MFMNFLQTAIIATPMFAFLCGAQINALRHGFEIQQKVKRLLIEQKNIIHHIPDGVLIYKYQKTHNHDQL